MNLNLQKCVGNNHKFLRTYHGLSQQRMAEAVNMTRSLYVQYELGNRTPDAEALFNIAQCFEIDMDLFFEEDSDAFLNGLICSKMSSKSAFELLRNYHALSPFSKGRLLEYSEKLMEWDRQKAAHLHDVETLRHTIF